MKYYVNEIDFAGNGSFKRFNEEVWNFEATEIVTPHGTLKIRDALFVEQGPHVGVQFSVSGKLSLNDFSCSNGSDLQQTSRRLRLCVSLIMFGFGFMPLMNTIVLS